jgi:hypothetical protein
VPIHIIDCDFYDNDGHHYGSGCHTLGAVSLTSNGETNHSIIEDSRFHNNKASNASAIHVSGKGKFTIRDNTFSNNIQKMYDHTSCVKSTDAQNVEIIGNIFTNNFYPGAEDQCHEAAMVWGEQTATIISV